jgi:hypothetical protein
MTREEADARAAALNADPAATDHWLVRKGAAEAWEVVRLRGPGLRATRPSGAHVESRPRPEQPDPRPGPFRDAPPFGPI